MFARLFFSEPLAHLLLLPFYPPTQPLTLRWISPRVPRPSYSPQSFPISPHLLRSLRYDSSDSFRLLLRPQSFTSARICCLLWFRYFECLPCPRCLINWYDFFFLPCLLCSLSTGNSILLVMWSLSLIEPEVSALFFSSSSKFSPVLTSSSESA